MFPEIGHIGQICQTFFKNYHSILLYKMKIDIITNIYQLKLIFKKFKKTLKNDIIIKKYPFGIKKTIKIKRYA